MIVVILVVFEKMATKPLEWGDHVVAIFYDDGDDGWLTSAVNSKSLSTNICDSDDDDDDVMMMMQENKCKKTNPH